MTGYLASTQVPCIPDNSRAALQMFRSTTIGELPADWNCESLGNKCELVTKGTTPTSLGQKFTTEGVLFLKAESISEGGRIIPEKIAFIDETTHALLRRSQLAAGDLLISIAGVLGRVGRVEARHLPANTNQALAIVRLSKQSTVDRNFLFWCLNSAFIEKQIRDINVQAAQANISLQNVRDLLFPLPPLPEQRAIAEVLSDVDGLLVAVEALIDKKRAIKQAAIQQLLTGQTLLPGFAGKWAKRRLGDLGTFSKGRGIRRDEVSGEGFPCVRYGELYTRYQDIILSTVSKIPPNVAPTALPITTGDLLFAGSGETAEEIGRCAAYLGREKAYAGGDIIVLTPSGQNSRFLGYLMNCPAVSAQKVRIGQGDAVVHISTSNLAQVQITLPPLEEQTTIANVLSDMDAEITALERRRDKTRAIKRSMMQRLLTGRVRLAGFSGNK